MRGRWLSRAAAAALLLLLVGCAGTQPAPPDPAGTPSTASPAALVRVIVELTDARYADEVLALVPEARDVKRTQHSPYLIMRVAEGSIPTLRAHPGVKQVSLDRAAPPASPANP